VRLENGLTILLRPVSGAKHAALVVLFNVGGKHDPAGKSGLGHLVEHLYVTAAAGDTPARSADQAMRNGNAQTGEDYTVIADVFETAALPEKLKDAAARMGDLRIEQSDLDREKPRLLQEVGNMFGGTPPLAAWNLARERLRPTAGGGRRGGLPAHVEKIGLEEARGHWRRYYKPRNAVLVLAGGFESAAAEEQLRRHFGKLPAGDPPPSPVEPPPSGTGGVAEVPVKANAPGAGAEASLAFNAPAPGSADYVPFLVLSARMQQRAVKELSGARAQQRFPPPFYYALLDDPLVVSVSSPVRTGETPEQAVRRLEGVLAQDLKPEITPADRQAVLNGFGPFLGLMELPDSVWAQNPYGLALSVGRRTQLGLDPAKLRRELEAVTAEDLRRVAAVFSPARRSAVVAVPQ
jgi:zinc protease